MLSAPSWGLRHGSEAVMGARRGRPAVPVELDDAERETLERWARRPKSSRGAGFAVQDRAGRRVGPREQRHRRGAGLSSRDGVEVAQAVRAAPSGRAERRSAAGPAAQDHRRGDRGRARAHPRDDPGGRDALVDAVDGHSGRGIADRGQPDMARVRPSSPTSSTSTRCPPTRSSWTRSATSPGCT